MKPKIPGDYLFYSVKVIVGLAILVSVAVVTAPKVFREKLRARKNAGD